MSYTVPSFRQANLPRSERGYSSKEKEGAVSTLCAGCGHDSISAAIIDACFKCRFNRTGLPNFLVLAVLQKRLPTFWATLMVSTRFMGECLRLQPVQTWQIVIYSTLSFQAMETRLQSAWDSLSTLFAAISTWFISAKITASMVSPKGKIPLPPI